MEMDNIETMAVKEALDVFLASTYISYIKHQNYHWNIEGSDFQELHETFGDYYSELFTALDTIAEVARQLGIKVIADAQHYAEVSEIDPPRYDITQEAMVADLRDDHQKLAELAADLKNIGIDAGSIIVEDLGITRNKVHMKTAWLLNSILK